MSAADTPIHREVASKPFGFFPFFRKEKQDKLKYKNTIKSKVFPIRLASGITTKLKCKMPGVFIPASKPNGDAQCAE